MLGCGGLGCRVGDAYRRIGGESTLDDESQFHFATPSRAEIVNFRVTAVERTWHIYDNQGQILDCTSGGSLSK